MGGGNRALYEKFPVAGPVGGPIDGQMGYVIDYPAAVTNNLPTDLTANDDEHLGVVRIVDVFDSVQLRDGISDDR